MKISELFDQHFIEDLKLNRPDLNYSNKLVHPVLFLEKHNEVYRARLSGKFYIKGEERIIFTQKNEMDWIYDDDSNIFRPLPKGICKEIQKLKPDSDLNNLSFGEVLNLIRSNQDIIDIKHEETLFSAAKIDASNLHEKNFIVPKLNASLFAYQAKGVLWMNKTLKNLGGLILADEMGLGKTIQIISLLLINPPEKNSPALIIAPTTLLRNWEREFEKFAPSLKNYVHHGSTRSGYFKDFKRFNVIITSYGTVLEDMTMFCAFEWKYVICDEAQAIKNPESTRRENICRLPRKYSIPMTGTPVENSLLDLWSITDFAIPGILGTKKQFEDNFPDDNESANELSQITNPIILRRKVIDVAGDLPERMDISVPLVMDELHAQEYCSIREVALEEYKLAGGLVAAGRLQMFCTHPWLQGSSGNRFDDDHFVNSSSSMPYMNPKLEVTKKILNEAFKNKRKVLIFVSFNKCGEIIKSMFKGRHDIYWNKINGTTPARDRQLICDEFENYEGDSCLILNPKAAGAGLNITAATVVIHFSPFWNPAHELQASARAYRRGQKHPVTIYMLFYEDTLEEIMIERSERRKNLGEEVLLDQNNEQIDLDKAMNIYPSGKQ
jgi:SNF2 family DNA or RNA helicase